MYVKLGVMTAFLVLPTTQSASQCKSVLTIHTHLYSGQCFLFFFLFLKLQAFTIQGHCNETKLPNCIMENPVFRLWKYHGLLFQHPLLHFDHIL